MSIVPDFYLDAVVSIGSQSADGISWFGTGFFILREIEGGDYLFYLVTNKHVLADRECIVIRAKKKDTGELKVLNLLLRKEGKLLYAEHPSDDIDIAAVLINGSVYVENQFVCSGFDLDKNTLTSSEHRENGVAAGTLVHMLGFPMGLVNTDSMTPICRLGCVARMDANQVSETHNILVDIQNFPGNSGSPIITRPEIVSIEGTKAVKKALLLGIIHSYIPYQEQLMNTQTKRIVEIRSENSGLANVHPVEYIREVLDLLPH